MGLREKFVDWLLRDSSTTNPQAWFLNWLRGGQPSMSGIQINQLSAMQVATIMAAVEIRAGDFAKLPAHVRRRRPDGGTDILRDHPLERILANPNEWQTRLEFLSQMQMSYLLRSNAYAAIRRNGRSQPVALIPVNPDRVTICEEPGGEIYYRISRGGAFENAQLDGFPESIPASEMLHLRWLSQNGLIGLSRIGLMRESIGLSLAQEQTAARLFGNGATPSFGLKTDKRLADNTLKRFREQVRERLQGLSNVGEIPVFEEGLTPVPIQMTMVDSDFIAGRKFQVEEAARAFDVPPHRLGITPEGGGAAILQAHQMYLNNTISKDAECWEQKLGKIFDLDGTDVFVEFDLDYFNRADLLTRVNAGRIAIIGSQMTPNEWRRTEDMPAKENGDDLLQPANMVKLGTEPKAGSTGPGSDTSGKPADGGDGDPGALPDPNKAMRNGYDVH